MRVFHFGEKGYMLSNIENSRIKIATINKTNDPYEFWINLTSNGKPRDRSYAENIKNYMDSKIGFLCFSEEMGNPLHWAHYTDNHQGLCLEFEIPNKIMGVDKQEPTNIENTRFKQLIKIS